MNTENLHLAWSKNLFRILSREHVTMYSYIPDAGNKCLIELANASNETQTILLTSEEEGVAVCAGADLVGTRGIPLVLGISPTFSPL